MPNPTEQVDAVKLEFDTEVPLALRHCGNTYKACCLPWGWCHCICGDCRVAKYATQEARNEDRQ